MKVAYAVPHPVSGAILQRIVGVVRSLKAARPDVDFTVLGPSLDATPDGQSHVEFAQVEEVVPSASTSTKIVRRLHLGRDTVRALDSVDPDLVIVYGGGGLYMGRIQSWARSRGRLVAADLVEWYDSSHLPAGKWGPFALDNEVMMRRTALQCDGVIAISTFLAEHLSETGTAPVVVVPPVLDVASVGWGTAQGPRQKLVYCGNPGLKDDLGVVVTALARVDPHGRDFEMVIAGPDASQLASLPGVDSVPASVRALGRLSSADSLALMASATWAPLMRPDRRFAHAGFPTKAVEALAAGTPLIANLTSDLGRYLVHQENAIVVRDHSVSSFVEALELARLLTPEQISGMARRARDTAEESFDFRRHSSHLGEWLAAVFSKGNS